MELGELYRRLAMCQLLGESRCGCASGAGPWLYATETNGVWGPSQAFP